MCLKPDVGSRTDAHDGDLEMTTSEQDRSEVLVALCRLLNVRYPTQHLPAPSNTPAFDRRTPQPAPALTGADLLVDSRHVVVGVRGSRPVAVPSLAHGARGRARASRRILQVAPPLAGWRAGRSSRRCLPSRLGACAVAADGLLRRIRDGGHPIRSSQRRGPRTQLRTATCDRRLALEPRATAAA